MVVVVVAVVVVVGGIGVVFRVDVVDVVDVGVVVVDVRVVVVVVVVVVLVVVVVVGVVVVRSTAVVVVGTTVAIVAPNAAGLFVVICTADVNFRLKLTPKSATCCTINIAVVYRVKDSVFCEMLVSFFAIVAACATIVCSSPPRVAMSTCNDDAASLDA